MTTLKANFNCSVCDTYKPRQNAKMIPWSTVRGDKYLVCDECNSLIEASGYKTIYRYLVDEGVTAPHEKILKGEKA